MASMRPLLLILVLSGCAASLPPKSAFDSTAPLPEYASLRKSPPLYEGLETLDWQPRLRVEYNPDGSQRLVEVK